MATIFPDSLISLNDLVACFKVQDACNLLNIDNSADDNAESNDFRIRFKFNFDESGILK
jgi:hypothetical protein